MTHPLINPTNKDHDALEVHRIVVDLLVASDDELARWKAALCADGRGTVVRSSVIHLANNALAKEYLDYAVEFSNELDALIEESERTGNQVRNRRAIELHGKMDKCVVEIETIQAERPDLDFSAAHDLIEDTNRRLLEEVFKIEQPAIKVD